MFGCSTGSHSFRSWTTRSSPFHPAAATHPQGFRKFGTIFIWFTNENKIWGYTQCPHQPPWVPRAGPNNELDRWNSHHRLYCQDPQECFTGSSWNKFEVLKYDPQECSKGSSWNIFEVFLILETLRRKAGRKNIQDFKAIWSSWSVTEDIRLQIKLRLN